MREASRFSAMLLAVFLLILVSGIAAIAALPNVIVADDCPPGTHHATEEDVAAMQAVGILGAVMGMCWDSTNPYVSSEVAQAKQFLISRYRPGPRSSIGLSNPKVDGIANLNPDFAVALAKMLRDAPYMIIFSAYRTQEAQGSTNPESNHVYGCAADLGYSQDYCSQQTCQWVKDNAPSYGIQIRMKRAREWNHVEPIAKDACRNNGPGVGLPAIAQKPSSRISDYARQLLGLESNPLEVNQAGQSQGEMCILPDGLQVPCSSIANLGSPPPSQSGGPTGGALPSQAQPQLSAPQIAQSSPAQGSTPVSQTVLPFSQTTSASGTPKDKLLSALEQIQLFAQGPTATSTATSAPFILVVDGANTARIQGIAPPETSSAPSTSYAYLSDNSYQLVPTTAQGTFASSDLNGDNPSVQETPEITGYKKILTEVRDVLLNILAYLKPFGRPLSTKYGGYDEWAE